MRLRENVIGILAQFLSFVRLQTAYSFAPWFGRSHGEPCCKASSVGLEETLRATLTVFKKLCRRHFCSILQACRLFTELGIGRAICRLPCRG